MRLVGVHKFNVEILKCWKKRKVMHSKSGKSEKQRKIRKGKKGKKVQENKKG